MNREDMAIEIKDLYVSLGGLSVLQDINLEVAPGDFLGVIGPNGGGKSTLLKTIVGLIKPDHGQVLIRGKGINKGRRHMGYVPQYAVFDRDFPISVREVVKMGRLGKRRGLRYSSLDQAVVDKVLHKVEMFDLQERQIGELSGGERQRVLVARALASEPEILLLDEPTASIDEKFESDFYELLKELNQEITIILVSHDISAISRYVKNIACLNRTLYHQEGKEISSDVINKMYGCPVDLIAHGVPHRVLKPHDGVVG